MRCSPFRCLRAITSWHRPWGPPTLRRSLELRFLEDDQRASVCGAPPRALGPSSTVLDLTS